MHRANHRTFARGRGGDLELVSMHQQGRAAAFQPHAGGSAIVGRNYLPVGQEDFGDVHHRLIAQHAQGAHRPRDVVAAQRFDGTDSGRACDRRSALLYIRAHMQQISCHVHDDRYRKGGHRGNRDDHTQLAFDREVSEPTNQ